MRVAPTFQQTTFHHGVNLISLAVLAAINYHQVKRSATSSVMITGASNCYLAMTLGI
jgi:hypothetical protein